MIILKASEDCSIQGRPVYEGMMIRLSSREEIPLTGTMYVLTTSFKKGGPPEDD